MKPQLEALAAGNQKIAAFRREKKLSQAELAERCGLSRQFMNLIEAGKTQPNVQIALRLAEIFGCSVEDLFVAEKPLAEADLAVRLANSKLIDGARLRLAQVNDRWVAHAADTALSFANGFSDADAVLERRGTTTFARLYRPTADLQQNIAIAGCDPALALLRGPMPGLEGRCSWVNCGSARALELLAGGWVHMAGLHYSGPDEQENLRHIERFDAAGHWQVIHFSRWEQGWMVRPGVLKSFHETADLGSKKIRLVNREPGSGSRHWLDAQLAQIGVSASKIRGYTQELSSHWECARSLVEGQADVAVGPRAVASVFGLEFLPVMEVAFDLVVPQSCLSHPGIQAVLQRIRSKGFQREMQMLPGYQALDSGTVVGRTQTRAVKAH